MVEKEKMATDGTVRLSKVEVYPKYLDECHKHHYFIKQIRKANREKGAGWVLEVFDMTPYVTVSMTRPDGTPYGVPMNVVRKDETSFYFHCASKGEKIDCLKHNPS